MALTPKKLCALTVSTTASDVYTTPTGKTTIIKNVVLCNASTSDVSFSLKLGSVYIMNSYLVPAQGTVTLDLSTVMNAGDILNVQAGSADSIHAIISGVEGVYA